ncbi:DUF1015 domain-containing protein [Yeguia hominis]|uniref:DUF1015 domain-containing protein n=1 Tax=Yeguia hominis TaxID=2763662 RepID=A0A926D901_9FIRM|nr:DUF1015 domain-containing protein [Yeguia hominis]MBC8534008.1 DUF1015 domain-containing protein [Yeguia hominis]
MAEIKPFRALRFTEQAGPIEKLTCPPYDIISPEQRRQYLETNPYNIVRLELPVGEHPYEEAGETLKKWEESGILKQDTAPALYIYEETFTAYGQKKSFKGFICRVKAEDFSKGVVLPHENTLSKAKADRFELMKATGCNFSQIYSLYMDDEHTTLSRIERLSQGTPNVEMDDGEVLHRLWIVNDPVAIAAICEDFKDRKLYIADGHHRYETALNFRNYCHENGLYQETGDCDYVMMMLVDMQHDGLVVFPTHRLIHNLPNFDKEALLSSCREHFEVHEMPRLSELSASLDALFRQGKKAFAFYCGGDSWTLLVLRDLSIMDQVLSEECPAVRTLDVSVLHTLILERAFGIDKENMANQKNLSYTRSFDEAIQAVQSGNAQAAFFLNPTRISEIRDVAAAGGKMPQKSTYFYPKLITGLVMNQMNETAE